MKLNLNNKCATKHLLILSLNFVALSALFILSTPTHCFAGAGEIAKIAEAAEDVQKAMEAKKATEAATAADHAQNVKTAVQILHDNATLESVMAFKAATHKKVVTFMGYSGAEYEDKAAALTKAREILKSYNPKTTLINIGATDSGIGALYEVAKEMGFQTAGVVSSLGKEYGVAKAVDHVFFVKDEHWGGMVNGKLSPTSEAMVGVSDDVVVIGGGPVSGDEMKAAAARGKHIVFVPAEMNHDIAIKKALKNSKPAPTNFRGEAQIAWDEMQHAKSLEHELATFQQASKNLPSADVVAAEKTSTTTAGKATTK